MTRIKPVLCGIDQPDLIRTAVGGRRAAFVTNAAARTKDGVAGRLHLSDHLTLDLLLSPEHGIDGIGKAGEIIQHQTDTLTGLDVYSLYRAHGSGDGLDPALADKIDVIIYDLPDLGVRFFTYISTCMQVLDFCAAHAKSLVILDRPCPLGGEVLEGTTLESENFSFIGMYPLPARYGLTIGELARLYICEQGLEVDLRVIPVQNWQRRQLLSDTDLIFSVPSPGMPHLNTALLYAGTCAFEGTNVSEGRGTPRPFSWFGAPWIEQETLLPEIKALQPRGFTVVPLSQIPLDSKYKGEVCHGFALEVTEPHAVRAFEFTLKVLALLQERYPEEFKFREASDQENVPFVKKIIGSKIFEAAWDLDLYRKMEATDHAAYRERIGKILLYT